MRKSGYSIVREIRLLQDRINELVWNGEFEEARVLQIKQYELKADLKFHGWKPRIKPTKILLKMY